MTDAPFLARDGAVTYDRCAILKSENRLSRRSWPGRFCGCSCAAPDPRHDRGAEAESAAAPGLGARLASAAATCRACRGNRSTASWRELLVTWSIMIGPVNRPPTSLRSSVADRVTASPARPAAAGLGGASSSRRRRDARTPPPASAGTAAGPTRPRKPAPTLCPRRPPAWSDVLVGPHPRTRAFANAESQFTAPSQPISPCSRERSRARPPLFGGGIRGAIAS